MSRTPPAADGFTLDGERTAVTTLLRGIVDHRELIAILARKEFFVRYRRTSLGIAWAVLLPLVQASVLALVLSRFVRFHTQSPYAVFVYAGMLGWAFFNTSVSGAATSIVDNSTITSRIYFPRALLPIMSVAAGLYGFLAGVPVLLALLLVTGAGIGPEIALVVPAALLTVVLATAFALVLSALHVYFRDVRFLVAAVLLPMFYATPVFYPLDALPTGLRSVVTCNPVTGVVQLFRLAIGEPSIALTPIAASVAWCALVGGAGLWLQARRDRVFADLL